MLFFFFLISKLYCGPWQRILFTRWGAGTARMGWGGYLSVIRDQMIRSLNC